MYSISSEEINAVEKVLKSKKMFRYLGNQEDGHCFKFEAKFTKTINSNFSLLLNSGTNALLCSLKALDIGEGDIVIIPAFTFVATIQAVILSGATPKIVNIDNSLCMNPKEFEKNITPQTKAVIPVHMDGLPCDMESIKKIALKSNIKIIEDVAQAIGGEFREKKLGTFGEAGCFSFNVDKIITCAEGGLATFNNEEDYLKAFMIHDHPCTFGETMKKRLSHLSPVMGHSMRSNEISGAILNEQLKKLPTILSELRKRKNIFNKEISPKYQIESNDIQGDCGTSFHCRLPNPKKLASITKKLLEKGIIAIPVSQRPAHTFWQWGNVVTQKEKILLFDSIEILTRTLKIYIDYDISIEETLNQSRILHKELDNAWADNER